MSMAVLDQFEVLGTTYDLQDTAAQEDITNIKADLSNINTSMQHRGVDEFSLNNKAYADYVLLSKLSRNQTHLNLFDKDTVIPNTKIVSNGKLKYDAGYSCSTFMRIYNAEKIVFEIINSQGQPTGTTNLFAAFYDTNKEIIGSNYVGQGTITVPEGAVYIRVAPANSSLSTFMMFAVASNETYYPPQYIPFMDGDNNAFGFEINVHDATSKLNDTVEVPIGKNVCNPNALRVGRYKTPRAGVFKFNPEDTDYITTELIPIRARYVSSGCHQSAVYKNYRADYALYDEYGVVKTLSQSLTAGVVDIESLNLSYTPKYISFAWRISFPMNAPYFVAFSDTNDTVPFSVYEYTFVTKGLPDLEKRVSALENGNYSLIAYGDSLTQGAGATTEANKYIFQCKTALGAKSAIPFGYGGSGSKAIAFTTGAISGYVPPSTRAFSLKYADLTSNISIALNQLNGKTVIIDGTEVVISQTGETAYSLPETYVPADYYKPVVVKNSRYTADIYVIWVGTNDNAYKWDIIDAMIAKLPHEQYVVMGMTRLGTDTTVENELKAYEKYGSHFFNTRVQIINNAFAVLGITPTAEDTTAMNDGLMPPSLLSDAVHFNDDGYEAIGKLLAEHIKALGYDYQLAD